MHHHDLERVGLRVAAGEDQMLARQALPDSDSLLAGIARRRRARVARRRALGVATSVLMLALVLFFVRRDPTHDAQTASRAAPKEPKLGVTRAEASSVPLEFVDGTCVVVKPRAVADVRETRPHGATIALESGTVAVDVVHEPASRWDIVAGQFDIRVTGTRFDATWDPQTKRLTVAMTEGSVRVSGPCVDEPLAAPHTKVFECSEPATIPTSVAELPGVPAGTRTSTNSPVAPSAPAAPAVAEQLRSAAKTNPEDGVTGEPPSVLLGLADTARLSGDRSRARNLYATVRHRFPRTDAAAKAAFLLGRMVEADGAADEASRFYATAIAESPDGPFAQDALGRTMELEERRGNEQRARTLAAEYLGKHPNGPYRAYAVSVLEARR